MRLKSEPLWTLTLYPQAGEAGGSLTVRRRNEPSGNRPDPARSLAEASRRARGKARRYCAANTLNRFWTLTYAESCFDPYAFRADIAQCFRNLRDELGATFAYAWVPEWHPGGHGLHAHFAVGQFIPRGAIERTWGNGFVYGKLIGDLPVGSGSRREARIVGGYISKYISKGFDEARIPGLHRYEVAQGFQPEQILIYGCSAEDVIERASAYMHAPPSYVWHSSSEKEWRAPPACWAQWA
jgi:hypothetical protein